MANPQPSAPPLPLQQSLLGEDKKQKKSKGEFSGSDPHHHEGYNTGPELILGHADHHQHHYHDNDVAYIDPHPHQYPVLGQPNPSPAVVFGFPAPPPHLWPAPPQNPAPQPQSSLPQRPLSQRPPAHSRWSTGLCSCCADPEVCLIGCCCPCVLFGRIASSLDDAPGHAAHGPRVNVPHDIDDGPDSHHGTPASCAPACIIWYVLQQFTAMGWIYSCGYRAKLQTRYGITPHHGLNCITHFCCWHCAFCQEYREIKTRNLRERQRSPAMVTPPPTQVMHF